MFELKPENTVVVLDQVKKALDDGAHPIAAFDADGTLWNADLGENFFKFQIDNRLVELPPDPWEYYQEWHERDPIPAYLWLAQINAGKNLDQVLGWAKEALGSYQQVPVFQHMVELIHAFRELGIDVYIVTASIRWAIQPAAELVGVKSENVIGIRTKVDNLGLVTDEQDGPITWREGKVEGLKQVTKGRLPLFAAGNTTGDLFLLDSATHVALANTLATPKQSYYRSEQDLLREAAKRDWYRITGQ